ncbi:hypothetical protein EB118_11830 [bacterium]|nr:hypothetical protein [bacterium]
MDEDIQDLVSPEEKRAVPVDKLAGVYIKIRDARAKLKSDYEAQDLELEEQMEVIEEQLLEACKFIGADSIRTAAGTVIRSIKSRYWTNDWDSMYDFVRKNDAFGLLERRIHQSNMKQFIEENPDLLPTGLNTDSRYSIVVRRSK